jgi:hypothetical protein
MQANASPHRARRYGRAQRVSRRRFRNQAPRREDDSLEWAETDQLCSRSTCACDWLRSLTGSDTCPPSH